MESSSNGYNRGQKNARRQDRGEYLLLKPKQKSVSFVCGGYAIILTIIFIYLKSGVFFSDLAFKPQHSILIYSHFL